MVKPDRPTKAQPQWWLGAVGYEVYVRSFGDGSGDGVGDLEGVRNHLDHLAWLGVDAVWVTPFYPSPGFDHGYDVSDYQGVDPNHGTLADFDTLVTTAHEFGLRVLVDIVPNHTSHLHPWFLEAQRGRDNPYRDYYLWRDPKPGGEPPNNWVSHFGGPAWTFDEASGQYYCHLFLAQQPDLNWRNERVLEEFDAILRFWLDRGVDGFRVDVAHGLLKDPRFRDNPAIQGEDHPDPNWRVFFSFDHRYDLDQPETIEIYRRWRGVVAPYGAMLIGEIGLDDPARIARYIRDDGLHSAFFLRPPWMGWEPTTILDALRGMHDHDAVGVSWAIDNHDHSRSVTRFGGGQRGASRSLAVTTLLFCLGGMPFLYQGQELGIGDGEVAPDDAADPIAVRNAGAVGRDGARTAMPWEPGPGNGFTTGSPWLRAKDRPQADTVAGQLSTPGAWIHRYRDLVLVRGRHPDLWREPAHWLPTASPTVAVVRCGTLFVVANLSPETVEITGIPDPVGLVFSSKTDPVEFADGRVVISAETTAILEASGSTNAQAADSRLVAIRPRV